MLTIGTGVYSSPFLPMSFNSVCAAIEPPHMASSPSRASLIGRESYS